MVNGQINKKRPIRFNSIFTWTTSERQHRIMYEALHHCIWRKEELLSCEGKKAFGEVNFSLSARIRVVRYNRIFIGWRGVDFFFSPFSSLTLTNDFFHTLASCLSMESNRICDQRKLWLFENRGHVDLVHLTFSYVPRSSIGRWSIQRANRVALSATNATGEKDRYVRVAGELLSTRKIWETRPFFLFFALEFILCTIQWEAFCCTWCDRTKICLDATLEKQKSNARDRHSYYIAWLLLYWLALCIFTSIVDHYSYLFAVILSNNNWIETLAYKKDFRFRETII